MSDAGKAVFLSYASQDAEAAQRICEALRAAGVEVWFDRNELVGGDAWDQKIRRQIGSCALMIPVISANTQARREGYFRLEWRLAVERMRQMDDDLPFLLPVVIDETKDAEAFVPERFREVQWTRLKGGDPSPAFNARVKELLAGGQRTGSPSPRMHSADARTRSPRLGRLWWALPIFGVTMALILVLKDRQPAPPASATPVPAAVAPVSEARQLARRAFTPVEHGSPSRDQLNTAEALCDRALAMDATDHEIWTIAARIDVRFIQGKFDTSPARRERALSRASRAIGLAPDLFVTRLTRAYVLDSIATTDAMRADAESQLLALLQEQPEDKTTLALLANLARKAGRFAVSAEYYDRSGSPGGAAWSYYYGEDFLRAEEAMERSLKKSRSPSMIALKALLAEVYREDLVAAREIYREVPASALLEEGPALNAVRLALRDRKPDEVISLLAALPLDYLSTADFRGPKAMLTGKAHALAGRAAAAQADWQVALTVVDKKLSTTPNDPELLWQKAELLACLGDAPGAEKSLLLAGQLAGTGAAEITARTLPIHLRLDHRDAVLAFLAKTFAARANGWRILHAAARFDPELDPLRGDPRFDRLLRDHLPDGAKAFEDSGPEIGGWQAVTLDSKSIAVLPFANLSDDKESGYFADGVHEDVLTNLAKISQLKVIARTSVMEYRGTTKKIPQIAQELGVAYLLEGSVRRAGNRVRVVCQLIDGRTGQHVLAPDPFDRDLADIFAIQSDIAQGIAAKLQAVLAPAEKATLERAPTANLVAYEIYLQAREALAGSLDQRLGEQRARPLLERAVQLDPNFALAWQGLGWLHLRAYYRYDQSEARRLLAKQAIEKACELEPRNGESLALQTNYYIDVRDLPRARELAARLEREHPSLAVTWHVLARLSIRDDNIRAALEYYRRARSLDPRNVAVLESLTGSLVAARRYDEAQAVLRDAGDLVEKATQLLWTRTVLPYYATGSTREMDELAVRLAPDAARGDARALSLLAGFASIRGDAEELVRLWERHGSIVTVWGGDGTFTVAVALLIQGQPERARILLEQERSRYRERLASRPDNIDNWFYLAATHAVLGDKEGTAAVKREMLAANPGLTRRGLWRYEECMLLAWLGDKEAALADLAERLAQGPAPSAITVLRRGLRFRPLQGDPRFEAMLADPKNSAPFF